MMTHELKIQEVYADAVYVGDKTFEVRYNDRGFQKGDLIKFVAIDDNKSKTYHPINKLTYEITYVLSGWGIKEDWVVLAIKELERESRA